MPGDRLGPLYWDDWNRPEYFEPDYSDDDRDHDEPSDEEEDDDEDPTY